VAAVFKEGAARGGGADSLPPAKRGLEKVGPPSGEGTTEDNEISGPSGQERRTPKNLRETGRRGEKPQARRPEKKRKKRQELGSKLCGYARICVEM